MPRRSVAVLAVILAGAILLAVIGGLALVASQLLSPQAVAPPLAWADPLAVVDVARLAPDVALRSLAGEPEDVTAEQALRVGEWETAYASIVYSASMDDTRRAGLLLLLADRYMAVGNPARAALCAYQTYDIAALSPALNDLTRAEVSLRAAAIWRGTGHTDLARLALEQATYVAGGSLTLQPAQRRSLWEEVASHYRALGDAEAAERARARAEKPEPSRAGPRAAGLVLAALPAPEPTSPEVNQAVLERQRRALVIIERLTADLSADVGPEAADLGEYLRREDAARQALYAQVIAGPELGPRAGVARARVRWLTLKWRVAQRAYGLSLVPEWEASLPAIRADLARAYEDAYELRLDQITALPDAAEVRRGRLEALRELTLQGRLGLYPDFPWEAKALALDEAVEELRLHGQLGGLALRSRGEGLARIFILEESR